MATLSPAERFGLYDRGALTPGRRADFCVINDPVEFSVKNVFRDGVEVTAVRADTFDPFPSSFQGRAPTEDEMNITGRGTARVIGLVPNQIITESLRFDISSREIPDLRRDILKVVVCNRYRGKSVWRRARPRVQTEAGGDRDQRLARCTQCYRCGNERYRIRWAIEEVFRNEGAMAAVAGDTKIVLPLGCAGLMSTLPSPEVITSPAPSFRSSF